MKTDFSYNKAKGFFLGLLLLLTTLGAGAQEQGGDPRGDSSPQDRRAETPFPFTYGERLVYEVRYLGVSAGTAVLSIRDKMVFNGREVYSILSTAESNDFVSLIYPVNNRIESYLDAKGLYSHLINVKQREGKRRREKRIEFNQEEHKALQIKDGQRQAFDVPPKVNDSLSSLYYFRTQNNLTVGHSVFIDVHESEKNWKLEIRVLGKETVTTPLGTFNTLKVQAMPRYEGIFLNKADLFIWVTDDDQKIPVVMKSKIKVGSITVTLISKQGGQIAPL